MKTARDDSPSPLLRRFSRLALGGVTAAILGLSWLAGPLTAAENPPFTGDVSVEVVNVEVWVTDRDGNPVIGLERDDFELRVDGAVTPLSNFSAPKAVPLEVLDTPEPQITVADPEAPSFLVLFIDHSNILGTRRSEVIASLAEVVEKRLDQGDRVMIVSNDDSLEVLSEFDDSASAHLAALRAADRASPAAFMNESEYGRILRCIEVNCSEPALIQTDIDVLARQIRQRGRITLARMSAIVDRMSGLPGRRALLVIGDGVPARPGESLYAALLGTTRSRTEANRFRLTPDIQQFTELANARRVTLYTLNTGGIVGSGSRAQQTQFATNAVANIELQFLREANFSTTVQQMAEETGGRVLFKPTIETLATIEQDLDTAYLLGFSPDHSADDRSRRLRVRVRGEDYEVRNRVDYRLTSDEGAAAVQTRLALVLGETANPLEIRAEFGGTAEKARRKWVIPVAVKVPIASITTVPAGPGAWQGRLEFLFQLEDEGGNSTPLLESELPLELPDEAVQSTEPIHITYDVGLKVRAGEHRVALTVTDGIGGAASTLTWIVTVGDGGEVTIAPR
jgi:VWFA-related protein